MKFPEKIPIERIEDYHTHFIGKYEGENQFWGYETFVFTKRPTTEGEDWEKYRREYVVLYLFDKEGNFKEAKYWFAGTTDKSNQNEIAIKLEEMIAELSDTKFCNIEVKPFQIKIDGFIFGLIPDEESEMITLQPSSTISFCEPWDGEYYT